MPDLKKKINKFNFYRKCPISLRLVCLRVLTQTDRNIDSNKNITYQEIH